MRLAQGYTVVTGPAPGTGERDTYTCAHCNRVHTIKPMCAPADMPNVCHMCGDKHRPSFICKPCEAKGGCDPFEEKLKRMETVRAYG